MALTTVQSKTLSELNKRGSRFLGSRKYDFMAIWRELDDVGYGLTPDARQRLMAEQTEITKHADTVQQIAASADRLVQTAREKNQPIAFDRAVRQVLTQSGVLKFSERAEQSYRDRESSIEQRESAFLQKVAGRINQLQDAEGLTLQAASKRVWETIDGAVDHAP